ncbi:hypothetical protein PR202_ga20960 [Eleusine coracana subsp. coracana]|uniref:Secreted protein n=1 Tax=Eleusine coracana subsp. coracana TaxID=191504 RepID=A0AAV5D0C7_ELECO|nr:hypothetical protein PR202_ga20960 [Eleusine coracana subsp. coracana]
MVVPPWLHALLVLLAAASVRVEEGRGNRWSHRRRRARCDAAAAAGVSRWRRKARCDAAAAAAAAATTGR